MIEELRTALACEAHDRWSRWMKYLFERSDIQGFMKYRPCKKPESYTTLTIKTNLVTRWTDQVATPYSELSEDEKKSDLELANDILDILVAFCQKHSFIELAKVLNRRCEYTNGFPLFKKPSERGMV